MIQANELRIGNWVEDCSTGRMGVVSLISKEEVVLDLKKSRVWLDFEDLKPIPITEEIILKCGFTIYDPKYKYFSHKDVPGILQLFDGVIEYSIDSNEVCWVNGLHQLQNLYHALTGQELKI